MFWLANDMDLGGMDMTGFRMIPAGIGIMLPANTQWNAAKGLPSAFPLLKRKESAGECDAFTQARHFVVAVAAFWLSFALAVHTCHN